MKDKYLNFTTSFITKYNNYSSDQIEEIRYGLEALYLTITKLIVILILSIILGIFKELIILLVFFNIIRFTGFGFHARNSIECLFSSILLCIGLPILMNYIHFSKLYLVIIGTFCLVILAIYAPADTIKRPLPNKKKRKIRKVGTILIASIYIVISYVISSYLISYLLITALILEAIMVSPIIYKIFKQPYRNYLNV